ncbi:lasso peptide biosynthesis B2 protein [Donghicola mangrovi]|uniref:lasso peptide biosynthesis B2 protein n=1 Tax=Donghicola mangrovi TaxID=2729614 RepID=UPI003B8A67F1
MTNFQDVLHWFRRQKRRFTLVSSALGYTVVVRLLLSFRKVDILKGHISRLQDRMEASPNGANASDLREVAWSVSSAARLVPAATCLTQALTGAWIMAKRGWQCDVCLTIPRNSVESFEPHAWLLHDSVIILGGTPVDYTHHVPFRKVVGRIPSA